MKCPGLCSFKRCFPTVPNTGRSGTELHANLAIIFHHSKLILNLFRTATYLSIVCGSCRPTARSFLHKNLFWVPFIFPPYFWLVCEYNRPSPTLFFRSFTGEKIYNTVISPSTLIRLLFSQSHMFGCVFYVFVSTLLNSILVGRHRSQQLFVLTNLTGSFCYRSGPVISEEYSGTALYRNTK